VDVKSLVTVAQVKSRVKSTWV